MQSACAESGSVGMAWQWSAAPVPCSALRTQRAYGPHAGRVGRRRGVLEHHNGHAPVAATVEVRAQR
eukprot:9631279-Alexandrium_andersonii.AAC.1